MPRSTHNPWLNRFAWLTALATLGLICLGGLVTSHGVGMAVPDWPNTYGYNMFFFPISKWVGGIFYEHTHRLVASGVGLLTTILAVWLWFRDSRPWVRWVGVAAWLGVVVQGVLGGLRVTLRLDWLGVFHGTIAQLFLTTTVVIALCTTRWWQTLGIRTPHSAGTGQPEDFDLVSKAERARTGVAKLRRWFLYGTCLVLAQLMLGATMRHQHAGLAIPDFPLAYGKLWPATDAQSIARYNQNRMEVKAAKPITAFQVVLQMAHRLGALAILLKVALSVRIARRTLGRHHSLTRLAWAWLGLILAQIGLGAATIWSDKSADIATAHVAVGALSLVTGALLTIISSRMLVGSAIPATVDEQMTLPSPSAAVAPSAFSTGL